MKKMFFAFALLTVAAFAFAETVEGTVSVSAVKPNKGAVYVAVYDSAESLKKNKPVASFRLEPTAETVSAPVSLPAGEYYLSAYQDENDNGKLDTKIIGIPKEPVGISNYDGKGIPGGFEKHKIRLDSASKALPVILRDIG